VILTAMDHPVMMINRAMHDRNAAAAATLSPRVSSGSTDPQM
jgi:hypothetical protein